jgi:hypothetical protein
MSDLTHASELLNLLDVEFDEITATRVGGTVAADERTIGRGGSFTEGPRPHHRRGVVGRGAGLGGSAAGDRCGWLGSA